MQQNLLLFLFLFVLSSLARAQQTGVTFKIINAKGEVVPFATVTVLPVPDTTSKQEKVTDTSGSVSFDLLQSRPYRVVASAVEYAPVEKAITIKGDNPTYTIIVEVLSKSLSNVVVTSRRPLMRQEDDKTIVDPENLAASSTNAYEILEKNTGVVC